MGSAFVYIAYAIDDASEVAEIAEAIRDSGWAVCFGHLAEPAADDVSTNVERLTAADCILVVWSSSAANSSVVRSDALEAAQQKKLVLVTLDDAVAPIPGQAKLQLKEWFAGASSDAFDSMLAKINERLGPGRKGRGAVVPYAVSKRSSRPWRIAGAVAFILVCLALILIAVWEFAQRSTGAAEMAVIECSPQSAISDGSVQMPRDDLLPTKGLIREVRRQA